MAPSSLSTRRAARRWTSCACAISFRATSAPDGSCPPVPVHIQLRHCLASAPTHEA
jgi:hypothetical protein